jgi:hypothetical protein
MNTLTVDNIELDGETVDRIIGAAGQAVPILVVMTTPKGRVTTLTAMPRCSNLKCR